MREIKFRAWHKEQNKMYSAEEMGIDQLTLMTDGRGLANISGQDTRLSRMDNGKHMIPLQYTGLHDKNGKEIYEGDIVSVAWRDDYGAESYEAIEVKYNEAQCGFAPFANSPFDNRVYEHNIVIGNIYENPDLLKVGR